MKGARGQQYMEVNADAGNNGAGNNFVFLRNFRLRPREDGWGAVANLDLFFNVRTFLLLFWIALVAILVT